LTPKTKSFRAKQSCLTESNSPDLFETCVSTSSEITITLIIFGTSALREGILQLQEDIRTDPSVTVDTSIPETTPNRADPEIEIHLLEHLEFAF